MKKIMALVKFSGIFVRIAKIIFFLGGGFLLYRNRQKIATFFRNQNFVITALYAILVGFIALFYRLIMMLNWLIQQAK